MNPILAIIVPIDNVEIFLRDGIESNLCQTFPDYDLLLVDDGSTDHSGQICVEYASWVFRILVFHKMNGGVSSTRNMALDDLVWRGQMGDFY